MVKTARREIAKVGRSEGGPCLRKVRRAIDNAATIEPPMHMCPWAVGLDRASDSDGWKIGTGGYPASHETRRSPRTGDDGRQFA